MKDKTLCRRCEVLSKNMVSTEKILRRKFEILSRKMDAQERIIECITEGDSDNNHLKNLVQENVRLEGELEDVLNKKKSVLAHKIENKIRSMIYSIKTYVYKLF